MTRRITCPSCGDSEEGFTVVQPLAVTVDIDAHGNQNGGADFANEMNGRVLLCRGCGYGWKSQRRLDLIVSVE